MQLFNQLNARRILDSSHIWEGLREAKFFGYVVAGGWARRLWCRGMCALDVCEEAEYRF